MNCSTVWLCCGVVRAEIEELHRTGRISGEVRFLDSMLHMVPQSLDDILADTLEKNPSDEASLVLVYGDCCPRMLDFQGRPGVGRVDAINCAQLMVGKTRYRELMKKQSFMLLPEWARRWQEILQSELGLSREVARDLMTEHRGELVYLDAGLEPVPEAMLQECSGFTGLPWRIEQIGLEYLMQALLEAEARVTK